jgi:vitamin B12 transporter
MEDRMKRINMLVGWMAAALAATARLHAQGPPEQMQAAVAALNECIAASQAQTEKEALSAADRAEKLFVALQKTPGLQAEALVGQARVISQCRISFANLMAMGGLAERSTELLERALAIDSMHAVGRYVLAMNAYHSPEFLGRMPDAIRELEWLVRVFADRTDVGVMADVYMTLGDAYEKQKRMTDAERTWRRGAALFPANTGLRERTARSTPKEAAPAAQAAAATAPGTTPQASFQFAPLTVEASSYSMDDPRSPTPLSKTEVYTTPGGTADLLQVFQTMPGATRVTEGSDLYVRGGDPAEAPVFIDGARLMYAGSFESLNGGVFGVLDPSVLSQAYFSSGGFSARYGNALSGILDVRTDGRPESRSWRAGLNLATAGATFRSPLGSKGGAWASVEGTNTSAMMQLHGRADDYESAPRALQGIGGVTVQLADNVDLKGTALAARDEMRVNVDAMNYSGTLATTGETALASLALNALSADSRSALHASVSASSRAAGFSLGVLDWQRNDRAIALRMEADHAPRAGLRVRAGAEAARMDALESGIVPTGESIAPGAPSASIGGDRNVVNHVGAFAEGEIRVSEPLAVVIGMRADKLPGEDAWSTDPRLGLAWRAGDWTLRTGAGVFHQGRWRTRYITPDGGRPSGVPTSARHLVLGAQHDGAIDLRVEAFYKAYGDYAASGAGPMIESGSAAGIDALARWRAAALNGWVTYSFIDSNVTLADGATVPSSNDVTHTMTVVARKPVGKFWEVGSTLRAGSGRPFTPVLGADPDAPARPLFGELHRDRMPAYARLDGRVTRLQPVRSGLVVIYLETLNLLDRKNVMSYTYDAGYRNRRPVESFFSHRTLVFGVEAQF